MGGGSLLLLKAGLAVSTMNLSLEESGWRMGSFA